MFIHKTAICIGNQALIAHNIASVELFKTTYRDRSLYPTYHKSEWHRKSFCKNNYGKVNSKEYADEQISTGVTGYIAGDALYALHQKHPDYEYAALVRTQDKADIVKKAYPNVRIVQGGLDDSDLLKEEAAKADVVLRMPSITNTSLFIVR